MSTAHAAPGQIVSGKPFSGSRFSGRTRLPLPTKRREAGTLLLHAALLVTVIWYVRKNVSLKMASLKQSDPVQREPLTLGEADLGAAIRAENSSRPKGPNPLPRLTHCLSTPLPS